MDDALDAMDAPERTSAHAQLEHDTAELLALLAARFEPLGRAASSSSDAVYDNTSDETYAEAMTVQVPTRLNGWEVQRLDELVADGVGESRSDVVRLALRELYDAHQRRRTGAAIAESYREVPQTEDDIDLAMSSAIALTEAEPW
eukprot:gene37643-60982_t